MESSKRLIMLFFIILFGKGALQAEEPGNFELSGHYLGMFNSLTPQNAPDTLSKNRQFDAAANLDILWKIHHKVKGNIQLQMGTGFGSLDFAISSVVVTDLNIEIDIHPKFQLTLGSFDTPFGADTPYLSNNANTLENSFFLNSLFYGVFAGTDVGTLNTIGLKGYYHNKLGHLTAAVTNGTDESALNPDGNFGFVISTLSTPLLDRFQAGISFIHSADSSKSGSSGTGASFSAGLIDAIYEYNSNAYVRTYLGLLGYDDKNKNTKDEVVIWKLEGRYPVLHGYFAARVSSWLPKEVGTDTSAVNNIIPPAGTGWRQRPLTQVIDQRVYRYQLGFGWPVVEDMYLKLEIYYEDYLTETKGVPYDITGFIVGLNAKF
jgi:hypothetical protein